MRALICGSRGWSNAFPINAILAGLDVLSQGANQPLVVIHGDAPGADSLAGRLAKQWGARVIAEPADWDQFGRAAGPIRNAKMLKEHRPEVVFAFRSSGKSNGTDDMCRKAKAAGIPVFVVNEWRDDD